MKTVMVTGSFDLLHKGHLYLFKEAKKHGEYLIVIVARDSTIRKEKGHNPLHNEQDRLSFAQEAEGVDKAILGHEGNKLIILKDIQPDILALGYDQKIRIQILKTFFKEHHLATKIVRLHPYHPNIYKSSKLKKKT